MTLSQSIKKLSIIAGFASIATIGSFAIQATAQAAAIISNGTVQLGIDDLGQLNVPGGTPSSETGTSTVGLRFVPTNADATSPGCLCEGWGVADAISGITGFANNASGTSGLTALSFTSTADSAKVVVTADGVFKVTHDYKPVTGNPFLYQADVKIENIGSTQVGDLRYRRVMDWDIEPTAFSEYVSISGTAAAKNVLFASDNGFASANPLSGPSQILATGDFSDSGPTDHGALFDFGFGALDVGKSLSFNIFYGAAPDQDAALKALGSVGAEVYSLGKPSSDPANGAPNTFMFAFKGVGGTPLPNPTPVPTPALLPGLVGIGIAALRKKRKGETVEQATEA